MAQYTFDTLVDFEISKIALPSGYTKLNYLKSNGSQYILLPSTNNNPSGVLIFFRVLTPFGGDKSIYGQIGNNAPYLGQNNNNLNFSYKSGTGGSYQTLCDSNKHIAKINFEGNKQIILDGNEVFTATSYFSNNKPLAVFNAYYNNGVYYGQSCEIYYVEPTINDTNGNVTSRIKLFPASNGTDLGLYDLENDNFYTNNGTGTFVSGGEAQTSTYQDGDVVTITDVGITLTYTNGNLYFSTNESLTLSKFNSLCSICKGTNGVVVTITENKSHYHWQNNDWEFWYKEVEPLAFKGITFEQTDYWQTPESVFRGFSFERENILRYYGVKIDVNGETERNYIPCIRTSDGIAGLYDTVNGVFYASVGTKNFTT